MSKNRIGTLSLNKPHLIGHWKFQEGPGLIVQDYSGAGRHGKIYGAKYVSNQTGNNSALQFDGGDNYVSIPNYNTDKKLSITNLTFLFGFKAHRVGNGGINGYSCGILNHCFNDTKDGWWIEWRNSGDLELGTLVSGIYFPFTIHDNFKDTSSWHIIKGNIGANGFIKVYLDDVLRVDRTIGNWQDSKTSDFIVGKGNTQNLMNDPISTNQYFCGIVGEIMIFNSIQNNI